MATAWSVYESPIGPLTLVAREGRLRQVCFPGERQRFELPLDLVGSAFERAVWDQLQAVPFGSTVSYGELARRLDLDHPEAAREVGAAVGRTPVPIVVPCHRVLAADGKLTGYRGGLERKRALLDLETPQLTLG